MEGVESGWKRGEQGEGVWCGVPGKIVVLCGIYV